MPIIKNYNELNSSNERKIVLDLIEEGLNSIQPENVFHKNIKLEGNVLKVKDKAYDLNNYSNIYLLGFGKGSAKNSLLLEELLGERLTVGYVIDTEGENFSKIQFTKGTHPVISKENVDFTLSVMDKLSKLTEKDLVLVVVCGGGSAMFEHPHSVSLEQKIEIEKALLKSGADITQMNIVRQHMSDVKGGGLAQILYPATVQTLIYSDVPGNDIRYVASGPTVKNDTSTQDALNIVHQFQIQNAPQEAFLDNPHDDRHFEKVTNTIILSNDTVLDHIKKKAESLGLFVNRYSNAIKGDVKDVARELLSNAKEKEVLIAAGETTVKVKGSGKGGRNQQLALEALKIISDNTVLASIDSDGWDFTDAAGAIADGVVKQKSEESKENIDEYLANNDSYTFFQKNNAQIITNRLPSNVSDFMIVLKK